MEVNEDFQVFRYLVKDRGKPCGYHWPNLKQMSIVYLLNSKKYPLNI